MSNKTTLSHLKVGQYLYGYDCSLDFDYEGYIPQGKSIVKAKVLEIEPHYFEKNPENRNIHDFIKVILGFQYPNEDFERRLEYNIPRIKWEKGTTIFIEGNYQKYSMHTRYNDAKKSILDSWNNNIKNIEYKIEYLKSQIKKIRNDKSKLNLGKC